jgi:hypothetical protein
LTKQAILWHPTLAMRKTNIPNTIAPDEENPNQAEIDGVVFTCHPKIKADRYFAPIIGQCGEMPASGEVMVIDGKPQWDTAEIHDTLDRPLCDKIIRWMGNRPCLPFANWELELLAPAT